MRSASPSVSVVLPALNEEACVRPLVEALLPALAAHTQDFEVVFVDDGSDDGTFEEIQRAAGADPRVKCVRLARNVGHQLALECGLEAATGDVVITMDADLQHPPSAIGEMLALWREGVDVVNIRAVSEGGAGSASSVSARLFYWLFNALSPLGVDAEGPDFRLLDRRVVDALIALPERSKFFRALVHTLGFQSVTLPIALGERAAGARSFTLRQSLSMAASALLSFSAWPLRLPLLMGALVMLASLVGILWRLTLPEAARRLATADTLVLSDWVLFGLLGAVLFALGVIGLYLWRVYQQLARRPRWVVRERLGFDPD